MSISITSRVRKAMVGLSLLLCALFTTLIFLLVYIIEDRVFVNQVKIEQDAFERVIANADRQKIAEWLPSNANIQRIDLAENLPEGIPQTLMSKLIENRGIHEYFDDENAMFIASLALPGDNTPYFLIYDVKDLLAVRDTRLTLFTLIAGLTVFITLIAVLLAHKLTKSTLTPVSRLTNALRNNDLDQVVIDLANEFSEDEIGILARELALALERGNELAQREYEFNRGVSHELRSPIQVAQSAVELLQLQVKENDKHINKPISRLHRSVSEMSEIADAFLWLASDRIMKPEERCSAEALQQLLSKIKSSFPSHEIVINTVSLSAFQCSLPNTVLSLVMRSLVRNSIIHGETSPITINVGVNNISISNAINSEANEVKGFGIGISIVRRICDRFACDFDAGIHRDTQYRSSIVFV